MAERLTAGKSIKEIVDDVSDHPLKFGSSSSNEELVVPDIRLQRVGRPQVQSGHWRRQHDLHDCGSAGIGEESSISSRLCSCVCYLFLSCCSVLRGSLIVE